MIPLRGRPRLVVGAPPPDRPWLLVDSDDARPQHARLITNDTCTTGFGLYVGRSKTTGAKHEPLIVLPPELDYLGPGDVIRISRDYRTVRVLWRTAANQNSILLTERCDNLCVMCSQPP